MLHFDFLEKGLGLTSSGNSHILCMISQEKCFSSYSLLTDQVLLSDCLYVLRY